MVKIQLPCDRCMNTTGYPLFCIHHGVQHPNGFVHIDDEILWLCQSCYETRQSTAPNIHLGDRCSCLKCYEQRAEQT